MLTLSILWVVLAATVTVIATKRKARARLRRELAYKSANPDGHFYYQR
jgi:hypothetical protein